MKNYCPHCKSDNFIYSKKSERYLCADCCEFFDTPYQSHKPKLFLSYGHKQSTIAERIKNFLEENGYEVWMDSQINTFDDWREKITNGIFESDHVLSLASRYAWRDKGVCLDELKIAICLKRAYVYVVLLEKMEDSEMPNTPITIMIIGCFSM